MPSSSDQRPLVAHVMHRFDVGGPDGSNCTSQWARRAYNPFVTHVIVLSRDPETYLTGRVGIPPRKVTQFYNGVDAERFQPAVSQTLTFAECPFRRPETWLPVPRGRPAGRKSSAASAWMRWSGPIRDYMIGYYSGRHDQTGKSNNHVRHHRHL